MDKFYERTPVPLMNPNKPLTDNGKPLGITALDYWRFQFSNIWDAQEEVAEFIVAKALGRELPFNKNGWTPYDIPYKGKRVEIKSTAYFHSWRGDGKVSQRRDFGITKAYGQHDEKTNKAERKNDLYVFCMNTGDSFETSDPFEMSHWEFYVVPTVKINELYDDRDHLSLKLVQDLAKKVSYSELKDEIDRVIAAL